MKPTRLTNKAGTRQAIIIIMINMLPMMAIISLVPIVPAIMQKFKDVPNIAILAPMVLAAPGLCVALLSPYAGYLSDKIGRRKLLLIFTLLYGIGGVIPFFIESFPLLLGSRLLLGIGEAFILTIGGSLWGDYYDEKDRAKWIVIQSITGTFLAAILLSLSGYLSNYGWNYPFLVYNIAFLIFISSLFFIFEPQIITEKKETKKEASEEKLSIPIVATLCLTTFITAIIYFSYTLHFSLILDTIGIKDNIKIGNYSAIASIGAPIGALLYKFVHKKSIYVKLAFMGVFYAIGFIGTGICRQEYLVVASAIIAQLGVGLTFPVLMAWSLNKLPAAFRGRGMGFWTTSFFLGQFMSPLVLSGVRELSGGLLNAYIFIGLFCLFATLINIFYSIKKNSACKNSLYN